MKTRKIISTIIMALVLVFVVTITLPPAGTMAAETVSIKLNKAKVTLYTTETFQLKLKGTTKKVTWSSSNKSVATVSGNGKVTAKKSGSATISAKVSGKTYKCKITVTPPSLSQDEMSMNTGNTYTLKLLGTKKTINWTTSDSSVATVTNGVVTAVGKGGCKIHATYDGSNQEYTCSIIVTDYLSCDTESINLKVGESKRIIASYGMTYLDVPFYFASYKQENINVQWDDDWTNDRSKDDESFEHDWQYGMTVTGLSAGKGELRILIMQGDSQCEYVTIPVTITE